MVKIREKKKKNTHTYTSAVRRENNHPLISTESSVLLNSQLSRKTIFKNLTNLGKDPGKRKSEKYL